MQNYTREVPALFTQYINGNVQTQQNAWAKTTYFVVSGGKAKGDHKSATPISFTKTEWTYPTGTQLAWEAWGSGYAYLTEGSFSGSLGMPIARPASRRSVAYNKAIGKFYDAIRQSERNLMVTLGESGESVAMFKSFLTGIATIKSGVRKALKRPDLALSGAWLVNQYGIQPAMADIYQWVDYCRGKAAHENIPVKVRASVRSEDSYNVSTWPPVWSKTTFNERVELKARYRVSNPELFEASRITSFNPAVIAYELTPLSFVLDWFIDIGGYLQNIESSLGLGLTFVDGYMTDTTLLTGKGAWSGSRAKPTSGFAVYFIHAPFQVVEKTKSRVKLTSFPVPDLPRLDVHLGSSRLASAAALLDTLFLSRGRR